MTNSTPKSSKIERQGSPNSHQGNNKRCGQRSPNYIKTATYFGSGGSFESNGKHHPFMINNSSIMGNGKNNTMATPPNNNNNNNNGVSKSNNLAQSGKNGNVNNGNSGPRNSRPLTNRQNCNSPNTPPRNIPRSSPMRHNSPRGSPTNGTFYAGAKFSEPPLPENLPKPPSHWTGPMMLGGCHSIQPCHLAQHLKMLINVQA